MQRAHRARVQSVYQHSELVQHHTCSDLSRSGPDYVPEAVPEAALEVLGSELSISNPTGSLIFHHVKGPGAHHPGRRIGPASAVYPGKIGTSQIKGEVGTSQIKGDAVHRGI